MEWMVAPTEPTTLKSLGVVSSLPEKHGVDYLGIDENFTVGIQRKEVGDLLASLTDGRLAYEIAQIATSHLLDQVYLLIEGTFTWNNDGQLSKDYGSVYTIHQHNGLLLSLANSNILTVYSPGLHLTKSVISSLATYLSKPRHNSLKTRPNPAGKWGRATSREWSIHLLQSFPGVGYERAEAILDHFGYIPFNWSVTEKDLIQVPGIGKVMAKRLAGALNAI